MSSRLAARAAARSWSRSARLGAELLVVLGEPGDLLLELADVVGLAEAGLAPGLLAEQLGEALLKLADAGGEAGEALVGGEQVRLQRGTSDGGAASRLGGWLGLASVDLREQVAVPVEEGPVHRSATRDRGRADLLSCRGGCLQCLQDALPATLGIGPPPGGQPQHGNPRSCRLLLAGGVAMRQVRAPACGACRA